KFSFLVLWSIPTLSNSLVYCAVDGERGIQRLLVYEFMQNRSLKDHLFSRASPVLTWVTRQNIILGSAQGLAYLHEELEVQVIYRDFKSSNVLLDDDFKPKLSDFGLCREGPTAGRTHVSTAKLPDWVKQFPADGRKFTMMIDPRLGNDYSVNAARNIAKLADKCLLKNAKDLPKMSEMVENLKQIIQVTDEGSPSERSYESSESEQVDDRQDQTKASESAKRRMDHLARLSEQVEAAGGRRFMIRRRAKNPLIKELYTKLFGTSPFSNISSKTLKASSIRPALDSPSMKAEKAKASGDNPLLRISCHKI
ncbi:Protein kinase domain, partial [Dillenia turbinata]